MSEPQRAFDRVLGRADLLLFSVCAILTIDSLASAASMGVAWFSWWVITMVVFFLPYGLVTAELGAAWPGEGGVYVWVREGLGPRWGSMCAWLYWINNAYWIPAVYLVFAGTFHTMFLKGRLGPGFDEGAGATWLNGGIAILLTWLTVAVGIIRLEVSKWLPNVGAVVKVAIFLGLGALGLQFLFSGGSPANEFSLRALLPSWSDGLAFLPILLYNTLGFELMSSAGEEMKEPQKDVPRVVLLSGAIICVVYMLGALGILLVVPLEKLSLLTGTWDALALLGQQWGTAGEALTLALGIGFLYACVANVVTWSLGVNRVAAAAAEDGMAPKVLGRLHPRYKTPYVAFVIMGAVSTALLVGNALLSSNPSNVFWMIFKLSSLCLLLCYLAMFPAFLTLRQTHPERPRPYRLPGGMPAAWAVTVVCWLFVFLTCLLFFKPAPGSEDATKEALLLAGETILTIVVGYLLIPRQALRA
ncbi:MAG TPA: APC family permease [Vicinamibacteria bacterium]